MDELARVSVTFQRGGLEISGSEAFIREQLDRFDGLIRANLATPSTASDTVKERTEPEPRPDMAEPVASNPYPKVIALEEDEVRVLTRIPGDNKAEKTLNATLLCLIGAMKLQGETAVSFSRIRDLCRHHSCLDSGNFSKTLKNAKSELIVTGTGKNLKAKLTHPGTSRAEELAAELNAQ